MKSLTKFAFFAALCGVFVGCGSDSGASASDDVSLSSSSHSELVSESNSSSSIESSSSEESSSSSSDVVLSSSEEQRSSSSVDTEVPQVDVSSSSDESSGSSVDVVSSSSVVEVVDPSTVVKGSMTDSRDGKTYKTVIIGEQTWMAENLNYAYLQPTADLDSSSFCFNNEPDSCAKYGRLYVWSAAMDSAAVLSDDGKGCGEGVVCSVTEPVRGVCPEGWHLPSAAEWLILITSVGGYDSAGTMLKSSSGWKNDGNGKDSYAFSALPAGCRSSRYDYYYNGYANFWSSTEYVYESKQGYAISWQFNNSAAYVDEIIDDKYYVYSVRCVKD